MGRRPKLPSRMGTKTFAKNLAILCLDANYESSLWTVGRPDPKRGGRDDEALKCTRIAYMLLPSSF